MSQCPKCDAPVPETSFGLYNCKNCKAVLSVDFYGTVSMAEEQTNEIISESAGAPTKSLADNSPLPSIADKATEIAQYPPIPEPPFAPLVEPIQIVEAEEQPTVMESMPVPPPDFSEGEPYELSKIKAKKATSDFEDVVAFANSEVSQAASGNFLYDILITGIDSEDLRTAVRESLTDARFGWNGADIIKKLRGGSIKIEKVNAIKASILVSRLKGYSLNISWVQNGIFEISP